MELHGSRPQAPSAVCFGGAFQLEFKSSFVPGSNRQVRWTKTCFQIKIATFGSRAMVLCPLDHLQARVGNRLQQPAHKVCDSTNSQLPCASADINLEILIHRKLLLQRCTDNSCLFHAVDAPGHLLCTAKQGTRRICDSQPESNKSSDTRKHGSFRRKADTGMKPQGSAGDTLASYLQKSNVQRTALQYRGNIASTSVDQRTRGVQQRVQQQLQAYRNSTIKEQRPKTTPAGGALRRASSLQYPSAASQAPLDGFPSPRQGKSQGVLHSHRTSSLEETPSCTNPLSESRFTRAANIAPCRSSLHQLEMQQRPATAADPSTVLQQMLKQGGIAHAGDELFPDHSSLAQLLQDFARDVLPSSRSSQTSNTRLSSPRLSQPSKEPQPKAPSSRKTAVHHKEEPEFFGTWKEWCQAEESGRKCKQQCAKSSTTSGTLNRADIGRIATGNPYKYKQQLGVYTGADSRSTMASDGVFWLLHPWLRSSESFTLSVTSA